MVHVKSQQELDRMRRAGRLLSRILRQVCDQAKEGVALIELDRLAEKLTRDAGAIPAFKGYLGFQHTLCLSVNEQVVHGIPSKRILKAGDIIGIDYGLSIEGYYSDSAITLPIGKVPDKTIRLMKATLQSLYAGIQAAVPGNSLKDIARGVESVVTPMGYGIVKEFVGHGIGQKLHEDPQIPNYSDGASNLKLKPGMTLAIEPMINEGTAQVKVLEDRWTAVTLDGRLSAHYEHTLVVTEGQPEILTEWEGGDYQTYPFSSLM